MLDIARDSMTLIVLLSAVLLLLAGVVLLIWGLCARVPGIAVRGGWSLAGGIAIALPAWELMPLLTAPCDPRDPVDSSQDCGFYMAQPKSTIASEIYFADTVWNYLEAGVWLWITLLVTGFFLRRLPNGPRGSKELAILARVSVLCGAASLAAGTVLDLTKETYAHALDAGAVITLTIVAALSIALGLVLGGARVTTSGQRESHERQKGAVEHGR